MGKLRKYQLLKQAYDKYPKGVKYKWKDTLEVASSGIFDLTDSTFDVYDCINGLVVYDAEACEWAPIIPDKVSNFRELLFEQMGIESIDFVKPSLLSGKCAIAVNNEREFKLLMEHRAHHGWDVFNIQDGDYKAPCPIIVRHTKRPVFLEEGCEEGFGTEDYKIIPFTDFAAETGIEVPVFVMTSEDGVAMYEGERYYGIDNLSGWSFSRDFSVNKDNAAYLKREPGRSKAFSTREAAENWISEQNKPKHATIALFRHKDYKSAEITADKITIRDGNDIYFLMPSDLEDMLHAYKSLQP